MPDSENREPSIKNPRIWVLHGARTGDNQQVSALARALGWVVEEKFLDYSPACGLPHFLIGATPYTVKESARTQLRPPWPDIVIASGRRSVAPARWIKQQSGHRAKLVQLGRPRAPLHLFDLVITTVQYGLPDAENILSLSLPLQSPLGTEDQSSEPRFAGLPDLPRPWTGILIGGSTWPFILDSRAASALGNDVNRWIGRFGGSVLITTSPRSDPELAKALGEVLNVPHFLHRWVAGADNPYKAILQSADRLIVTSDSVSMLADACRSGKPVAIWKTGLRRDPFSKFFLTLGNQAHRDTSIGILLRWAALKGLFTPPRHVERLINAVIAKKRASWFDPERPIDKPSGLSGDDDMEKAIGRVRALFD
ncbi:MAG: ELM1/GtrOC1 family putative glycosyltransferase [Proteobacteria bacterium]|nr:ELM1/GtrOC1 family putative glycosyltransferase [Pseudomonadota bacterium]